MIVVEVGIKLENDLAYYSKVLIDNGLINDFKVKTHDLYYTNKDLNGLSENQMKNACIRLRSCNDGDFDIQNKMDLHMFRSKIKKEKLLKDIDNENTDKYDNTDNQI